MKPVKTMLSAAAIVFACISVNAQTVDDVINKHLDAAGGKDKLAQVTSVVTEASVNAMGNDNPATTTVLIGKGYKNEMEFNGQKMVQTVTDKGGWAINPFQGGTDAQAMPDEQYKSMEGMMYLDPFLDYAAHGAKAELQGTDGDDYKVLFTSADGTATTYYINKTTYLFSKLTRTVSMMGNNVDLTMTFSDYKPTDFGNKAAYTIEMDYGGQFQMTTTIKKITINSTIDPAIFEMPK
ncbi:MAG TPA: hypothetical protein VG738_24435 [Chitinophagaceae bacterium]|nr:hypothetical protein [Chitinophagaceae bacterium]